jgi:hypothetical protein
MVFAIASRAGSYENLIAASVMIMPKGRSVGWISKAHPALCLFVMTSCIVGACLQAKMSKTQVTKSIACEHAPTR